MINSDLYNAAFHCGSFDELLRGIESFEKSLPECLRMSRFVDSPHDSEGVNYWCATPAPTTRFKKNIIGQSLAQLVYLAECRATGLFPHVLDVLLNEELKDSEEMWLSFYADCRCKILRTLKAGSLSILPYVTLPAAPTRPENVAYVPIICSFVEGFPEEITFTLDYFDGVYKDINVSSREALCAALQRSPVNTLESRPFISWDTFRATFGQALHQVAKHAGDVAFEFVVTVPIDRVQDRIQRFASELGEAFDRTFVMYGFENGYDPLVGLRDAIASQSTTWRFPILHATILTMESDVDVQVDGLLDTQGAYGLELQCTDREWFESILKATNLEWTLGTKTLERWKILPNRES